MFRFIVIVVGGHGEEAALLPVKRPTRTLSGRVALVAATALHHFCFCLCRKFKEGLLRSGFDLDMEIKREEKKTECETEEWSGKKRMKKLGEVWEGFYKRIGGSES